MNRFLTAAVAAAVLLVDVQSARAEVYVEVEAGASDAGDFGEGETYGVGVGLDLPLGFRIGASASIIDGLAFEQISSGPLQTSPAAIEVQTLMLNAAYQFPSLGPLSMFVGAGAGSANVDPDDILVPTSGNTFRLRSAHDGDLAWRADAGFTLWAGPGLAIDLAYRRSSLGEIVVDGSVSTSGGSQGAGSIRGETLSGDLTTNTVRAGLRYKF